MGKVVPPEWRKPIQSTGDSALVQGSPTDELPQACFGEADDVASAAGRVGSPLHQAVDTEIADQVGRGSRGQMQLPTQFVEAKTGLFSEGLQQFHLRHQRPIPWISATCRLLQRSPQPSNGLGELLGIDGARRDH